MQLMNNLASERFGRRKLRSNSNFWARLHGICTAGGGVLLQLLMLIYGSS